jgi:hypothetical protein
MTKEHCNDEKNEEIKPLFGRKMARTFERKEAIPFAQGIARACARFSQAIGAGAA